MNILTEYLGGLYQELQPIEFYRTIFKVGKLQEIKNKSKLGASQRMIAKEYKTSVATINKILRDKY